MAVTVQEEAVAQAPETLAQARLEAEQIISDARADADVTAQVAARQLQWLERQRDSVAAYLTEMRGVLGGALPQAPSFSDHVAALPQEPSPAAAPEQTSAQSAEPAASGSAGSPRSAGSGSASSAPSATSAAPAPAGNKAAAASGGGQQAGAQSTPKNAQKSGPGRIEHVPAPGKSSNGSGSSSNRNPRQGKGRR